jgi:sensor histidine kinase YesM
MDFFKRYYIKTGVLLAIGFPGVFVFDKAGKDHINALMLFCTFFFLILILWIVNAIFINFTELLRNNNFRKLNKVYRNIALSLLSSVPLYFILGIIFRQEQLLFGSLFRTGFSAKSWFYIVLRIVLFDAGLLVVKFIIDNNKLKKDIERENGILKMEQLKATHETFKQQVDPHFLFNSLNTLQSLVKQHDTENTLRFIMELSQVYRYMLTRRAKDHVSVREEIDFLQSYLYLLKIRFGEAFHTVIDINSNHISSKIPVHTLQLLAENAVKHNAVNKKQPLVLEIRSEQDHLSVVNNLQPKNTAVYSSGIGLQNINNRYSLLFGKEISIFSDIGYFKVLLPIITGDENINY